MQQVTPREIYFLPDRQECNLPALSIECVLHGIQPSLKQNPKGFWSDRINSICKNQIFGVLLYGRVSKFVLKKAVTHIII